MSYRPEEAAGVEDVDLSGQTVLVTGATSGIGRETALAIGRLGAHVIIHGRNVDAGKQVVAALEDTAADGAEFIPADFARMEAVRGLAREVRDRVDRLDVLVNNAGAHIGSGVITEAGVEKTFTVNHLAPFLLTNLLSSLLPADGRVVTVASALHRRASGEFAVESVEDYDGYQAYCRSKLANVLFTRELARRLEGPIANCCHPGFIPSSELWREARLLIRLAVGVLAALPAPLRRIFAETPASGARTSVYLAASPAVADVNGGYFSDCERGTLSQTARDDELAHDLWQRSVEWVDLDPDMEITAD